MGIGIGGDYPMSSAAISDRSATARRGMLLAFTFSMQGWGNFLGGIITLIIIYCYKSSIQAEDVSKLNGVWRLIFGVILIPCIGTLYQRIVLPESEKYKNARALQDNPDLLKKGLITSDVINNDGKKRSSSDIEKPPHTASPSNTSADGVEVMPDNTSAELHDTANQGLGAKGVVKQRRAALGEFIEYFSDRKHALTLFSTAANWFLLDIAFYGINLNQSIVLSSIGYNRTDTTWNYLHDNTVGNLIITAAGFLPGYYLSIISIEYIGRKPIQLLGFFGTTLMLWIVAGTFQTLQHKSGAFIACFTLLQFLFNFG
jgi:PHS family inorganic phosphate transporter-like MFS transporter